jgi:hypothetical protein
VTDDTQTTDNERVAEIEDLARDLAQTISTAPPGQRERLREMAVHLLRDEVDVMPMADSAPPAGGGVNPFAIGIPLVLVGGVMLVLFPPVGLVLFAVAVLTMLWGLATVLFSHAVP